MAKLTLTDISNLSGNPTSAQTTINANWDLIETALENTLSRDGTSPNTMEANLDMNSNRILNLPQATNSSEPATLEQLQAAAVATDIPDQTSNRGKVITTDGSAISWQDPEWVEFLPATYASATTFTVTGDQTADFHAGRRVKCTGGADRYATIVSSVYTTLTTVTVDADDTFDSSNAVQTLHASMDTVYLYVIEGNKDSSISDNVIRIKTSDTNSVAATNDDFHEDRALNLKTDYAATGDGVADDAPEMLDFLTDIETSGGVGVIPEGTYLLTSWAQHTTAGDLHLKGEGAVIIKGTTSLDFIKPANNIKIEGIKFDTWNTVLSNASTDSGTIDRLEVHKCQFDSVDAIPITLERPINRAVITENEFNSNGNYCIRLGKNDNTLEDTWQRMIINDNVFNSTVATSTNDATAIIVYGQYATITGNIIDGVTSVSGECWGIYTKCRYADIANNKVLNLSTTSGTIIGINIKGSNRSGSTPKGFNVSVMGNKVELSGVGTGIRSQQEDVEVVGNHVNDAIESYVIDGTDYNRVDVSNNIAYGTNQTSSIGVRMTMDGDQCSVKDNIIYNQKIGIRVSAGASKTPTQFQIHGNNIKDAATTSIAINPGSTITGLSIKDNHCKGTSGYGIRFDGSVCDDVVISGNEIEDTTTAEVSWGASSQPTKLDLNHLFRAQTTDATTTSVFSNSIPDNSAYRMETEVVAMQSDGSNRNLYHKQALLYRDGGNATVQGAVANVISDIESAVGWDSTIAVSTNNIVAQVTGAAATTINWSMRVKIQSVH